MNIHYLKFLIPIFTIVLVAFVYFSPIEFKILPMAAVIFMATGFNYALFKHFKTSGLEKKKGNHQKPFKHSDFEKNVKFAKPLRIVGMILFAVLMLSWTDFVEINLHSGFSLIVIAVLITYFFLAVNYYRKEIKKEEDYNSPN
jgi:positive regulator of sigma E activity